jgi:CMP-N,N'-diacetyllegionaminic acid synthase
MEILITLCGRGGSKGIPGKNIKIINGLPLIAYSIKHAKQFAALYKADIALSSDSKSIIEIAADLGVTTNYFRPKKLANDNAGKAETLQHVLVFEEENRTKKYDYILDLDLTSPLRSVEDLESAFKLLQENKSALNLFSVNKAIRNPYFNMVEIQENGFYGLVKKGNFLTRQSAPIVYELNASFYFYRRSFFDQEILKTITERSLVYELEHICFDLDHPIDFEFMEYLMIHNKLDFKI